MAVTDARPSAPVKVVYGLGALGEAAFTTAMGFVFFYYTAALGFSGSMVGAALFLGLCADAIVDPFFGSWSDNIRSRFGRRIPLMLAGGPLLALSVGMLFAPPQGLAEPVMFVWLAFWAVAVRTFFSMFHVPYVALGAEMSGDYHERNSIVAWRTLFLILAGFLVNGLAYSVFFAGEGGLQQAGRYPAFGWAVAALVLFGAGLCAAGSAPYAARLPGVPPVDEHLLRRLPSEIVEIFRNRSFRVLFASAVLSYVGVGVNASFNSHAYVFVWQLRPELIQVVVFAFLGGLLAGVPLTPLVSRVVEKRTTVLIGMGLVVMAWMTIAFSRLAGAFTATGSDAVLPLAVLIGVAGVGAGFCAIAYPSMMADAADEHEHLFGRRREGLYFAGLGFAFKAGQGAGMLVSGMALDLIGFPKDVGRQVGVVLPEPLLDRIVLAWGPGAAIFTLGSMVALAAYGITRRRHAEVAAALRARREAAPAE
ncbi:MFS transporter [Phenylobacterium sp.]|uniref:MFS transporter n=1 Tax=Phenylobacterium sp. TaxID=1871053 RepID=UPI00301BC5D1